MVLSIVLLKTPVSQYRSQKLHQDCVHVVLVEGEEPVYEADVTARPRGDQH